MTKSNVFVEGSSNKIVPQSFPHWIYIRYTLDFDHSAPYLTQAILIESLVRVWDMNYPVGTAIDHLRPCVYSALHFGGKHPFSPIYVALFGQKPKNTKCQTEKRLKLKSIQILYYNRRIAAENACKSSRNIFLQHWTSLSEDNEFIFEYLGCI